ncbi:serine endoprotease [Rubripirellula amarantea]|uniref:Serine endoprotease n=1 Tax=Rubripirellula amarantea TaxID=2527999 RepID=A0A5C5WEW6_9BACT|nr:PDZ domain-containing protein [Rubripirellula amarantea]TWT49180.1 serine endoprotease [Rubripirellula amarantea]
MPRSQSLVLLTFLVSIAWLVGDSNTADAQLFRRLQALRQQRYAAPPTRPPATDPRQNYAQPNYQGRNQLTQPRQAPGTAERAAKPATSGAVARYGRTADNDDGKAEANPTRASAINPADEKSGPSVSLNKDGDEEDFGSSILADDSNEMDSDESPSKSSKSSILDKEASTPSKYASMGIDVFKDSAGASGVRIARIREDSFADEGGMRVGDQIVKIDDVRTTTVSEIASILRTHEAGDRIKVQFVRDRQLYVTSVPLVARSTGQKPDANANSQRSKLPSQENAELASNSELDSSMDSETEDQDVVSAAKPPTQPRQARSPANRVRLGLIIEDPRGLRGVLVTDVRNNMPGDVAGLKPGDRIVSVDGRLLADGSALRQELQQRQVGEKLTLGIVRNGQLATKTLTLTNVEPKSKSSNTVASDDSAPKSGNLATGLGSMIGGFFNGSGGKGSGSSDNANVAGNRLNKSKPAAPVARASYADEADSGSGASGSAIEASKGATKLNTLPVDQPNPTPIPTPTVDDVMDFGDGEPIEQTIFTAPRSTRKRSTLLQESDPPSLNSLPVPQ